LLLVLAPRRPERFPVVAEKLRQAGVNFSRRSERPEDVPLPGVLLLDSIGELAGLFERATVVFMGGTLAQRGGHNILEPAFFGKPVIVGPHMENFAAIIEEFSEARAVVKIDGPEALASSLEELLENPHQTAEIGQRAAALARAKRGTADRIAEQILMAADEGVPNPSRPLGARITLGPCLGYGRLAMRRTFRAVSRNPPNEVIQYRRDQHGRGGEVALRAVSGAQTERSRKESAILTRGYGRKSRLDVIVPGGESASVAQTGDEAQIFIRRGVAHVGIGANRYDVGRKMEQQLQPGVFLLDDGFQHFA
jgi:hypothetical protein